MEYNGVKMWLSIGFVQESRDGVPYMTVGLISGKVSPLLEGAARRGALASLLTNEVPGPVPVDLAGCPRFGCIIRSNADAGKSSMAPYFIHHL
jgi:hypothetical protein